MFINSIEIAFSMSFVKYLFNKLVTCCSLNISLCFLVDILVPSITLYPKSKIVLNILIAIINSIKYDKEKTFVEIARIFNVSRDIVSDINNGATWYFCDEEYPIRDNSANKNKLTENEVYDIYAKLKNKMSLTDIAKEYNVSITNISNINQGIIYRFLEDDSYPIYVPINSKPRVSIEKIKKVVELLKHNPDYTYSKIGNIVGIGRKTVSGINNGKLYTDLVEELGINEFPIR